MEISLVLGTIVVRDRRNRHWTEAERALSLRERCPRPAGRTMLRRVAATALAAAKERTAGARRLQPADAVPGGPGRDASA